MKTLFTLLLLGCGVSAFAQMDSLAYINWISKADPAEVTQLLSESTEEFALRQYRFMSGWEQTLRRDYLEAKESLRSEEVRSDAEMRSKTKMRVESLREQWTPASELLSATREVYLSREGATLPSVPSIPQDDIADSAPRPSSADRPSTTSPSSTTTSPTRRETTTSPTGGKSAAQRSREMEAQKEKEKEMLAEQQRKEEMKRKQEAELEQQEAKLRAEKRQAELLAQQEREAKEKADMAQSRSEAQRSTSRRDPPRKPSRSKKKKKATKERPASAPNNSRPTTTRRTTSAVSNTQPSLSSATPAGIGSVCDWSDASQCTSSEEVILLYDPTGTGDLYSQYYVEISSQLKLVNDQVILSYTIMLEDVPMAGDYSPLPAGSQVNLRLLGAQMLSLTTRATSSPSAISNGKIEYSFQCFLSADEAAIFQTSMLDGLEVIWPKGPQVFPIQNSDIYKRQLECQMKCKG